MNFPFKQESSSELASYGSRKSTNLSRFLGSITPSLLSDMRKYLKRNKFLHEIKNFEPHKISLYEDIYAIVTLKQKEAEIFNEKGKLKQVMQEIAEYTKRKFITIDERLRKKIYQLNPNQLKFYLDNDKEIIFRGNSKNINTDEWPEHLKRGLRNHSSDVNESSAINLDSENQSIMSSVLNENQKIISHLKLYKKKQKKPSVIEEVVRIMNEPEANDDMWWPEEINSTEIVEKSQIYESIDFLNTDERETFAEKVIEKWRSKNVQGYLNNETKLIAESKICYNFRQREYLFINPKLMKSVFEDLRKEEQVHISHKKKQQQAKRMVQNRRNRKSAEITRYTQKNQIYLIEEKEKQLKSTVRKNGLQHRKNESSLIQLENSFSENQFFENPNTEVNAENLIQFLEEFAKNTNLQTLPEQARQLLEQGLKIKDQAKVVLLKQAEKNKLSQQKRIKKEKKPNILNLLSDQQDSGQKELSKDPIYWFNNDHRLYTEYQKNPFKNGYIMWTPEEDNILREVNQDFNSNSSDLEKLVKLKSAEMVKKRIDFLQINMNFSLRFCIENFLKR